MNNILIIEHEEQISNYFKVIVEKLLPESNTQIVTLEEAAATFAAKNDFSVIIVTSEKSFDIVPLNQRKNVVIHARAGQFVHQAIVKAETNVILWSADFYDGIMKLFSLKKLI